MAAVCDKRSCPRPTSADSCTRTKNFRENRRTNSMAGAVIVAPYVSWNHILKQGYWCIPVCILNENRYPKMALSSDMPTLGEICKQNDIHGRCGIDFYP